MSRLFRFAAVAIALVVLSGMGCKKNTAPEPPDVSGPTKAAPGDSVTFRFTSVDPDGDSVRYSISWGDDSIDDWSPASPSDEEYARAHAYAAAGTYYVKAKAKDVKDAESDWSEDSVKVTVGSFAPETPSRPAGPTKCTIGIPYTFRTKAVHPLGDSVFIRFFWGNAVGNWTQTKVASGEYYEESRIFYTLGSYQIAAQAKGADSLESEWSDSLVITVDSAHVNPGGAPSNLTLTAASDTTVNLTWSPPADSSPKYYVVSFQRTGSSTPDSVWGTQALSFTHDPAHRTGRYLVTAVFDSARFTSIETPSTVPVGTGVLQLPELNGAGSTGFGWSRTNGLATVYDMTTADSAAKVDFYISDFAPGFAGPDYYAASPFRAPQDPGGIVPAGNWPITEFTHLDSLATEDSLLPRYLLSRYRDSSKLDTLPRLVACHTENNYFALLRVSEVNTTLGTVRLETWFQLIPGLRLMEH